MHDDHPDPAGARPQVGLCVLRVERQQDYLLITITTTLRLEVGLAPTTDERSERFTDPAEALRSTAQFLAAFQ